MARMLAGQHGTVWVGTDTDERISSKKGPSRPINTLKDRMLFLSSIKFTNQKRIYLKGKKKAHHMMPEVYN